MKYLEAVCMETLRLHPSVPKEAKYVRDDDILPDGTHVYKGLPCHFFHLVSLMDNLLSKGIQLYFSLGLWADLKSKIRISLISLPYFQIILSIPSGYGKMLTHSIHIDSWAMVVSLRPSFFLRSKQGRECA